MQIYESFLKFAIFKHNFCQHKNNSYLCTLLYIIRKILLIKTMDKNTITGFVLIAAVLIGFSWWNQPSEEQMAQMRLQDSLQEVARKKAEETKKAAQLAATEKKPRNWLKPSKTRLPSSTRRSQATPSRWCSRTRNSNSPFQPKAAPSRKPSSEAIKTRKAIPTSYSSTKKSSSSSSCFQARNRISSQATYSSHRQT